MRRLSEEGLLDLTNTRIIAISAITQQQFEQNPNNLAIFDYFSKFDYANPLFLSGETGQLH